METDKRTKKAFILSGIGASLFFFWSLLRITRDFFMLNIAAYLSEGRWFSAILSITENPYYGALNCEFASLFAVPLFFAVVFLAVKGGIKARLIWLGFIAFFLHINYIAIDYNLSRIPFILPFPFFFFSLVYGLQSLPTEKIKERLVNRTPIGIVSAFFVLEILLIVVPFTYGAMTCSSLFRYEQAISVTYLIQIPRYLWTDIPLHLCLLTPLYGIVAFQLIRQRTWGYSLAPILLVKDAVPILFFLTPETIRSFFAFFTDSMGIIRKLSIFEVGNIGFGIEFGKSILELKAIIFVIFTLAAFILSFLFIRNLREE